MHDVMAAIATDPWPIAAARRRPRSASLGDADGVRVGGPEVVAGTPPSATRSCGRRGPASDGSTVAEVELEDDVELGPVAGLAPQALGLRVALDEVDARGRAPGQAQVGEGLVVDREQRRGRPELGAHVRDRRPVGERQARPGRRPRTRRTRPTTPNVRSISVMTSTRSVAVAAVGSSPVEPDADDPRHRLVQRLAQEDGLGLDPADAVAQHAEPVDHRRVGVGPDERVRERDPAVARRRGPRRPWPGTRG